MKSTNDKLTADLTAYVTTRMSEGASRERVNAEIDICQVAASARVANAPAPAERGRTLSDRTKEIMTERRLPFARAQSEASREFRSSIVRGGR